MTMQNALPPELLAVHVYSPLSDGKALGIRSEYVSPSVDSITRLPVFNGLRSFAHVTVGVGVPGKSMRLMRRKQMRYNTENVYIAKSSGGPNSVAHPNKSKMFTGLALYSSSNLKAYKIQHQEMFMYKIINLHRYNLLSISIYKFKKVT